MYIQLLDFWLAKKSCDTARSEHPATWGSRFGTLHDTLTTMDDRKRATFIRGLLLAWMPCVLFVFRSSRLIPDGYPGFGMAVAGGPALYAIPILPCEVAALFFLLKSFSRKHPLRTLFSVLTALGSAILIILLMTTLFSAISGAF